MTTKFRRVMVKGAVTAFFLGAIGIAGAGAASADHVHSLQTGNGSCVLLAQDGGEKDVTLPFATEAQVEARRAHPLHLLVHLGRPGQNFSIGVYSTAGDPCAGSGEYVND